MADRRSSARRSSAAKAAGLLLATSTPVAYVASRVRRQLAASRSPSDVAKSRPGDDLVPDAPVVLDRSVRLPADPATVWPWLVQLGKGRGGWYFPRSIELVIPPSRRGLRRIEPRFQDLDVADRVPDWGPGDPQLQVVIMQPPRALVYLSLRDRDNGHRWPPADRPADSTLRISWGLYLDELGPNASRLHLRLRASSNGKFLHHFADLADTSTVLPMFAGLTERLTAAP